MINEVGNAKKIAIFFWFFYEIYFVLAIFPLDLLVIMYVIKYLRHTIKTELKPPVDSLSVFTFFILDSTYYIVQLTCTSLFKHLC